MVVGGVDDFQVGRGDVVVVVARSVRHCHAGGGGTGGIGGSGVLALGGEGRETRRPDWPGGRPTREQERQHIESQLIAVLLPRWWWWLLFCRLGWCVSIDVVLFCLLGCGCTYRYMVGYRGNGSSRGRGLAHGVDECIA